MASGLPPPPTRAASGDFAWTSWYNQLYTLLSTTGSVSWALVNKAGSSIADLATKNHNLLTSMQGGTSGQYYHLTAAEHTYLSNIVNTFGGFYSTVSQTVTAANTATAILFNSTEYASGITIGTPTSRIVVSVTGLFTIDVDMQISKANSSTSTVDFWFMRNGVNVVNSATTLTLSGNNVRVAVAHTLLEEVTAGDYFEIMFSSADAAMSITATGTQTSPTRPAAPSCILTVTQVR
jgi:hypothetical protein